MIRFEVLGTPAPQGSMKAFVGKDGRAHVVSDNKAMAPWRTQVAWGAREAWGGPPTRSQVTVVAAFWFARPASVTPKKRPNHTVKPDVDKLARAILDAMTGIVFVDDSQVTRLDVSKRYCDAAQPNPCAAITVWVDSR